MTQVDDATKEACRFIKAYHAELGALAPEKYSRAEQHAILVLAAYIRAMQSDPIPVYAPRGDLWQPIATAPKEHGKKILVCEDGRTMAVVMWLDKADDPDSAADNASGWHISDGHNDPIWYRNHPYLTHWMPLPAPPGEDKGIPVYASRDATDEVLGKK